MNIYPPELLELIRAYKAGPVTKDLIGKFIRLGCVRHLTYQEPPQTSDLMFVFAKGGNQAEAWSWLANPVNLPAQASVRFAYGNTRIDFIVSGPLPKSWDAVLRKHGVAEYCPQYTLKSTKRYRWRTYSRSARQRPPLPVPRLSGTQEWTEEQLSQMLNGIDVSHTNLIFDYSKLPILSFVFALDLEGDYIDFEFWDNLDEDLLDKIRDLYEVIKGPTSQPHKSVANTQIWTRKIFGFCEFEYCPEVEGGPACSQGALMKAYEWSRDVKKVSGIKDVYLIPTSVISEGHDYYDLVESYNHYLKANNTMNLAHLLVYRDQGEREEHRPEIQAIIPVGTLCISGGPGSGKTQVLSRVAAAALQCAGQECQFDVLYVQFKSSNSKMDFEDGPSELGEARAFAHIVRDSAGVETKYVKPVDIYTALMSTRDRCAYYTECIKTTKASDIIGDVERACLQWRKASGGAADPARGVFILFDELLNQQEKALHAQAILRAHNELRSKNIFVGIIGQSLSSFQGMHFGEALSFDNFLFESTVIIAGKLAVSDEAIYTQLAQRAKAPIEIRAENLTGEQPQGQVVILPRALKSGGGDIAGPPVRVCLPKHNYDAIPPGEPKWEEYIKTSKPPRKRIKEKR